MVFNVVLLVILNEKSPRKGKKAFIIMLLPLQGDFFFVEYTQHFLNFLRNPIPYSHGNESQHDAAAGI